MSDNKIIEVGGVKLEVDLRTAKTIECYKVGDAVRVLVKKYQDTYESYSEVIIGFDAFKARPTIVVAYIEASYNTADVKIANINSGSEDIEIAPAAGESFILSEKSRVEDLLDRGILSAENKLEEERAKKAYFQKYFGLLFEETGNKEA